jgi:hypothetical protein
MQPSRFRTNAMRLVAFGLFALFPWKPPEVRFSEQSYLVGLPNHSIQFFARAEASGCSYTGPVPSPESLRSLQLPRGVSLAYREEVGMPPNYNREMFFVDRVGGRRPYGDSMSPPLQAAAYSVLSFWVAPNGSIQPGSFSFEGGLQVPRTEMERIAQTLRYLPARCGSTTMIVPERIQLIFYSDSTQGGDASSDRDEISTNGAALERTMPSGTRPPSQPYSARPCRSRENRALTPVRGFSVDRSYPPEAYGAQLKAVSR